uniref:Unkown protein n=1 Tax=Riptortus pedestris TaxID=329032 RepID=R4WE79_RIPPE|nr:unkown protein [Riptortus pedestris]
MVGNGGLTAKAHSCIREKAMKVAESESHRSGDGCKLCKEKQKRSLSSYIRNKSVEHSTKSGILEEEEEEECKK